MKGINVMSSFVRELHKNMVVLNMLGIHMSWFWP